MNKLLNKFKTKTRVFLKMLRNFVLFIALIWVTFFIIFKDQDFNELLRVINSAKLGYVLLAVGLMICYYSMEAFNVRTVLKSLGERISFFNALRFTFIGFFFSAITPAASGGQPIEIYYMTKYKVKSANATMALLIQACGFQASTISLGILCALLNPMVLHNWFFGFFLLGIVINSVGLAFIFIAIFSKRLTRKIVLFIIRVMKIFKVKKIGTKVSKIDEAIKQYNDSSLYIKTHKKIFIFAILRVFVQMMLYYSVPFCIYKSFGLGDQNIFQLFTMQAVLYCTVSGLPLPGAIGVSESVFLSIYEIVFGKELLNGAMLLSRGITFYLFVAFSLLVVMISAFRTRKIKSEIDNEIVAIDKVEADEEKKLAESA